MAEPSPLALEELERVLARYVWLERRLFELLGQWVSSTVELEAKLLFGVQSRRHAWRVELFTDRLPLRHDMRSERLLAEASTPQLEALLDRIAAANESNATIDRLVGVHRVLLPAAIAAHSEHLQRTTIVADGPTSRALRLVLTDETADQQAGEQVLQALLEGLASRARADELQRGLESDLTTAGGLVPAPVGVAD